MGSVENESCSVRIIHHERVEQARRNAIEDQRLTRLSDLYKALGDRTRLKLLMALLDGEMCVCDLAATLGVTESAVSHQLRRLRGLALVKSRRSAQVLFYSLNDDHIFDLIRVGLEHIDE